MKEVTNTVATAIRIEYNQDSDQLLVVFEITDPLFKQKIKNDWNQDIELIVVGKGLKVNI